MKFKEIFNLIPATKYIGVVAENRSSEKYEVLYQGIASKMPPELGDMELNTLSSTTIDFSKPILTIGVNENESNRHY